MFGTDANNLTLHQCFCIGRQIVDGVLQPACPCGMSRGVNVGTPGHIDHGARPCLWDSLSDEQKRKPMMLSCPCPKCTPSY